MPNAGSTTHARTSAPGRTGGVAFATPNGREPADDMLGAEHADWSKVAVFAAGILAGALAGASIALLTTPQAGWEARGRLSRRARRAQLRAADAWDDLGYDVRRRARRTSRRAREALRRER